MVIVDVMDDLILAPERYPENFVLISLLEVCQEWGVKKGGYIRVVQKTIKLKSLHQSVINHSIGYEKQNKPNFSFVLCV